MRDLFSSSSSKTLAAFSMRGAAFEKNEITFDKSLQNIKCAKLDESSSIRIFNKRCEGCDSNARIPTKMGPKPIAFDLAGQPSH